jgi:hypothetical protein
MGRGGGGDRRKRERKIMAREKKNKIVNTKREEVQTRRTEKEVRKKKTRKAFFPMSHLRDSSLFRQPLANPFLNGKVSAVPLINIIL